MCGINGFLTADPMPIERLHAIAQAMSREQLHRWPDDAGVWSDETTGVALGFRRLAILDLSAHGHQPMLSADGHFVIVLNGEIYNYLRIKEELEASGVAPAWRGHSDTEVLLAAVSVWGLQGALRRTNGMFTLAVWDKKKKTLHLARDRAGEKPLYYGWQKGTFLFASELNALKVHPDWNTEIDRGVLGLYMRYGYVPCPHSIYRGILKLSPGSFLTLRWDDRQPSDPQIEQYWSAAQIVEQGIRSRRPMPPEDAVVQLDEAMRAAVRMRMHADVPIGAFLSGGIDSSTIVALMQAESVNRVKTFSIGFSNEQYNEAAQAKRVAQHLGTDHTEVYLNADDALKVIPRLARIYREPFADSSQIPTFLVSAVARERVTVALSGDGGDELFGGYNRYSWGSRVLGLSRIPQAVRSLAGAAIGSIPPRIWDGIYRAASPLLPARVRASHPGESIHKLGKVLGASNVDDLYAGLTGQWGEDIVQGGQKRANGGRASHEDLESPLDRMMAADLTTYLPDDILVKLDRASMAVSLEARVPFLDHDVIALAWRLPPDLKFRDGQGKWIIRELLSRYVPRSLTNRPKMGFGVPIGVWLRGPLKEWASELLDERRIRNEGFFLAEPITKCWQEHLSGRRNRQHLLWSLLMFQSWLESESARSA